MLPKHNSIDAYFTSVDEEMFALCPTLKLDQNPLTRDLNRTSTEALSRAMCQYSFFSRDIVMLLRSATLAFQHWTQISLEIERNINEEMGDGKPGASHYELLGLGVSNEFGLDITHVIIEPITSHFLDRCHACMRPGDPEFTAGAIYALEATASQEITVLKAIVCELSRRARGRDVPTDSILGLFLDGHICNFEPEHKARLRDAIAFHFDASGDRRFFDGFKAILSEMYLWWMNLSTTHELSRTLA